MSANATIGLSSGETKICSTTLEYANTIPSFKTLSSLPLEGDVPYNTLYKLRKCER